MSCLWLNSNKTRLSETLKYDCMIAINRINTGDRYQKLPLSLILKPEG